eukprot:TRINITY_DN113990_c0_g1_i1.p1 TRINITY_DN113990_c0_g1~~TRINITY_DN113990_c0_g1_i1.p1  ORF type:complete len:314 (+),score=21.16 TRINITY_DN113990_c0_g1_i1:139-942(+)
MACLHHAVRGNPVVSGAGGSLRCPTCRKSCRYEADQHYPFKVNLALEQAIACLRPDEVKSRQEAKLVYIGQQEVRLLFRPTIGRPFVLSVSGSSTVGAIREQVSSRLEVPTEEIVLSLNGNTARLGSTDMVWKSPPLRMADIGDRSLEEVREWTGPPSILCGVSVGFRATPKIFLLESKRPAGFGIARTAEEFLAVEAQTRIEFTVLGFDASWTGRQLKEEAEKQLAPRRVHSLIHAGRRIDTETEKTMQELNIKRECHVHVVFRSE